MDPPLSISYQKIPAYPNWIIMYIFTFYINKTKTQYFLQIFYNFFCYTVLFLQFTMKLYLIFNVRYSVSLDYLYLHVLNGINKIIIADNHVDFFIYSIL